MYADGARSLGWRGKQSFNSCCNVAFANINKAVYLREIAQAQSNEEKVILGDKKLKIIKLTRCFVASHCLSHPEKNVSINLMAHSFCAANTAILNK